MIMIKREKSPRKHWGSRNHQTIVHPVIFFFFIYLSFFLFCFFFLKYIQWKDLTATAHIYRMETRVNYLIFHFLSQTPNTPLLTVPPPQTYLFYPKYKAFFTKSFIMLAGGLGVFCNTYCLIGNGGVVTC